MTLDDVLVAAGAGVVIGVLMWLINKIARALAWLFGNASNK